jgi:hypothetical protein
MHLSIDYTLTLIILDISELQAMNNSLSCRIPDPLARLPFL